MYHLQEGRSIPSDDPRFVQLSDYIESLKGAKGITMPVLQEAQNLFGYLPLEVQKFVSDKIKVPVAELYGVTTFYSQFNLTPKGKLKISVCMGTACYVKGAQALLDKCAETLNVEVGGTTADNLFTLEATRCLGCCSLAPVMMIGDDVYAQINDVSVVPGILRIYQEEGVKA